MSGAKQRKRGISTAQIKMRLLNFGFDGTLANPLATGFDRFNIKSITKLAAGQYTIIFKSPFERACELMGFSFKTAGIQECEVVALAYDRITVTFKNSAGADTDAVAFLSVIGSDARYDVE